VRALGALLLGVLAWSGTAAGAGRDFVLDGRGWGHGVGMSQWGAEGLAIHGYGYRSILAHYYPGTELARTRDVPIRVLLADGRSSVTISSRKPFRVVARGRTWIQPAGSYRIPGRKLRPPLLAEPGAAPLALDGDGYRGALDISGSAGSLTVVNVVPLERYVRGVVPWEVPFYWRRDALEAQAVAARSYALSQLKPEQSYDVFSDARDQMYGGIGAERPATDLAVGVTAGQVLTWHGRIALTYYSSTSGGRTEAVSDAVPGAPQVPYLVSVPDPYDSLSPHHRWGPLRFSARTLASRLGLPSVQALALALNGSGRVAFVTVRWPGGSARIPGRTFQADLGLPSAWFFVKGAPVTGNVLPAAEPVLPPPTSIDWPLARRGWTVVIDSVPRGDGLRAARAEAARASQAGAPGVGVLDSGDFSSLNPGYYVVFSGVYGSRSAVGQAAAALAGRFPDAYPREVAR